MQTLQLSKKFPEAFQIMLNISEGVSCDFSKFSKNSEYFSFTKFLVRRALDASRNYAILRGGGLEVRMKISNLGGKFSMNSEEILFSFGSENLFTL